MSMCWCKDCVFIYKGKCINGKSNNHMDKVGDHNSCKYSKKAKSEGERAYVKGYKEGYKEGYEMAKLEMEYMKNEIVKIINNKD